MVHTYVSNLSEFIAVTNGIKTADIKKEEKPYSPGDTIVFQEYDDEKKVFTGNELSAAVTNVTRSTRTNGLKNGFVMIEIKKGLSTTTLFDGGYGKSPIASEGGPEFIDTAVLGF